MWTQVSKQGVTVTCLLPGTKTASVYSSKGVNCPAKSLKESKRSNMFQVLTFRFTPWILPGYGCSDFPVFSFVNRLLQGSEPRVS